jgi:hypothetical protein
MLQIQKIKRPLRDEKEFKKLKGYQPFEMVRQVAKGANFSLLFGAAPYTFMSNTLEPMWSKTQAEEFIVLNKLELLKEGMIDKIMEKGKPIPDTIDYLVCATFIRNTFFKSYPGLLERIERNKDIVLEKGYTRTYHGIVRRLPLLMLSGKDDDYKDISGNINIAANSSIQSLESMLVNQSIVLFNRWSRRNKLKTRIWNTVHDSVDFYLYEPELKLVIPKIYEIFERKEEWMMGVPLTIEFKISFENEYKSGKDALTVLKELTA